MALLAHGDRRHRVHRQRPRALGPPGRRRLVGVAASSPEARRAAAAGSAPSARSTRPRSWSRDPDVDVVHICTPNHLHRPARRGRARGGQARDLREAARARRGGRAAPRRRSRRLGPPGRRPVRLPLLPDRPRGARARRAAGETGALRLMHGTYLQDWLLRPDDDNWRVDERARRRVARVRRHRLALVRPGRVRLRPPHRRGSRRACSPRCRSAPARPAATRSPPARRRATRARDDRGRRARPVRDRRRRARLGRRQPDLGGPQEPALARARRRRGGASPSTRSSRRSSGAAAASRSRSSAATPRRSPRAAARFAFLPGGHPQGYADCFDAFVADFYEAVRGRRAARRDADVRRRPARRADHRRRARLAHARSAGSTSRRAARPRRWRREARLPHRLHARAQPRGHRRLGGRRTATRRSSSPPGRSSATGRSPRATSRRTPSTRPRPSASAARSSDHGLVLSALAYYDNNLAPDPAERDGVPRPPARLHRRRGGARRRSRRHVHRPRPRPHASPRTCARPSASSRRSSTTRASAACA